jgi:hypothetical protein
MDKPLLADKEQFPTEEIIFSHIGESRIHWETIFEYIHINYPEFIGEWRYYNDGKSWLMKMTRKSKTIFWLSVVQDSFKITFYFGDKAEPVILASSISGSLKESFQNGKRFGKIRAITVQVENEDDVENVKSLIEIKLNIK